MMNSLEQSLADLLHASVDVTPALALVGRWIAAHPVLAVTQSAEEVARACGSSLAAVNRFAKHAGYEGFADLRLKLGKQLHQTLLPVTKLQAASSPSASHTQVFEQVLANLNSAAHACDAVLLDRLAERVCRARKVLFMGFGASNHVAAFGANALQPYLPNVVNVAAEGGSEQAMRRLAGIGKADVLVAISLPRYSRDAVALAAHARGLGTLVIAITDDTANSLAEQADYVLLAPAQHPVLSSSPLAAMAMAEALVAQVVQRVPEAARRLAELSESVLPYLTLEAKPVAPAALAPSKRSIRK